MKNLFFIFIVGIISLSCSYQDDYMEEFKVEELNLPSHIEEYGKEFAKNIEYTVNSLNEKGINYLDANYSKDFQDKFYTDWLAASPSITKGKVTIDQFHVNPIVFAEKYNNLTPIQLEFINRVIEQGSLSNSYEDFYSIIRMINQDIYNEVPKIEQERLLYITSVLFYGLSEVYKLQKQGRMLIIPQTKLQLSMLKTKSESGSGDSWGTCRTVFQSTCSYVVGTLTYGGEVVTSISQTMIGGVMMFAIVLCFQGDTNMCDSYNVRCIEKAWKYENGNWIRMNCQDCLQFCKRNGYWNQTGCPLN